MSTAKQRSKSKKKPALMILNDNSDGEIEGTTSNSNPIIVPIISTEINDDDILSPNELERMLNYDVNEENALTKTGFDYDFMSQITQSRAPLTPLIIPQSNKLKKKKKVRLSQTPPPTLHKTHCVHVKKPINKSRNNQLRNKKKKKRKFKPPRLIVESQIKYQLKKRKSTHLNEKPPETVAFSKASSCITSTKSNRKNKQKMRVKIKKASFNKAKLRSFLMKERSFDKLKTNEDPYSVFMNAIPEYDDDFDIDIEATPQQLDVMTNNEYILYKEKLKLPATRSIASANTLQYRNIPRNKPNLSTSKSAISRAKLVNFDAILNELKTGKRKRKRKTSSPSNEANKKRKVVMDDVHLNIADFGSFPTLKDITDKSCINKHDIINDDDIMNMTLTNADDYAFNDNCQGKVFILNEDDIINNNNNNNCDDLLNDDWSDIGCDNRHIRNNMKSNDNINTEKGTKGWRYAYSALLELGCDPQLLLKKWVRNHWKMIVWSLASRVRSFPFKLSVSSYFSYNNVFERLKYRYEYELNCGHLSSIRLLYRGDLSASSYLILMVSRIVYANNNNNMKSNRLWLSDGWYEIEATFLDSDIESLVESGDIKVGDKLKICMARKEGPNCEALESKAVTVSIQIARNYVRKTVWYSKLGCCSVVPNVFRVSLRSIHCNGGCVPYIYCCITRRYCNQYSIKIGDDKRGKIYTEKAKERLDSKYESEIHSKMIEIRLKIAKEMGLDRFLSDSTNYNCLNRNELRKKIDTLKDRVHSQIMNSVDLNRKISPFFTCKIHEIENGGKLSPYSTEITVWNPNDNISQCMKEGQYVKIYNINTQNRINAHSSIAQLSAGTRSKFEIVNVDKMGYKKEIVRENHNKYILRRYHDFSKYLNYNAEFDMIGCVVKESIKGIFLLSLSGDNSKLPLVFLKMKQNENTLHYRSINSKAIYIIRNIKYDGYDDNLSLHSTFSYQRTQFISNASSDSQFEKAKQFVATEYVTSIIQLTKAKIDSNQLI